MSRRTWLILFIAGLFLFILAQQKTSQAANQTIGNDDLPALLGENQTVPTRTPTPGPTSPPPTKTRRNDDDNPTPVPTSTPLPQATATATLPPTIVFTPVSGFMPTAAACSSQPTIQAQNIVNVRLGPGSDYGILRTLAYLEVRPIIGRAADAPWWLIQFDDGNVGWVADEVILVHGYIGLVPTISAPAINGNTPTPGAPWNPTPNPNCPVTPTNTPEPGITPTATSPAAEMAAVTETAVAEASSISATSENDAVPSTATAPPQPTQTAVSPPTLAPSTTAKTTQTQNETAVVDTDEPGEPDTLPVSAAPPLDDTPAANATDLLLPIAGVLLLAAGVVTFINRRRTRRDSV